METHSEDGRSNDMLTEIFSYYDFDGDGYVDVEDVGTVLRACGENPTVARVEYIVEKLQARGVKRLDFADFIEVLKANFIDRKVASKVDICEEAIAAMKTIQGNRVGKVNFSDFSQLMKDLGERMNDMEIANLRVAAAPDKNGDFDLEKFARLITCKITS